MVALLGDSVWRHFASNRNLRAPRCKDAGYALADALVALLILSMSLVLAMRALEQARAAADAAWEVRRADVLLAHLIEFAPHDYASSEGARDGFSWRVETAATGAERPIEVCRRAVVVENAQSGRVYRAATLETCPLEPAA